MLHQKAYLTQLSGYYIPYIIMVRGSLRLIYVRSGSTVPRLSILPLNPWNKKDLSLSSLLLKAKKNKQIFFTDTGRSLAEELVLPVIKAEEQSFTGLDKKELEAMFDVSFKHLRQLENLITNLYL